MSNSSSETPIVLADSITHLADQSKMPLVVICGSHGGMAAGIFALRKPVGGVIFNDAGVGKDRAGIAALPLLDKYNVLAATVDAFSARIGVAEETAQGTLSHVNRAAKDRGILPGMKALEAAQIMSRASFGRVSRPLIPEEDYQERLTIIHLSPSGCRIVSLDSNSMVTPENRNDIILTGSHGGLVGTAPAVKYPVIAALYNDAGIGKNGAGISRLPWLQKNGIIAATVDANTARIGVGMDTYESGMVSFANELALDIGISRGISAREAAWKVLRAKENR